LTHKFAVLWPPSGPSCKEMPQQSAATARQLMHQ
jgi:hypothetical protein